MACRALYHWVAYNRIIMPDNHINEDALVWEFTKLVKSTACFYDIKIEFEKRFSGIPPDKGNVISEIFNNLEKRYADVLLTVPVLESHISIVIEVKQEHGLSKYFSNRLPDAVKKDFEKLCSLQKGIPNNTLCCYVLYIAQDSLLNTIMHTSFIESKKLDFRNDTNKDPNKNSNKDDINDPNKKIDKKDSDDFELYVRCVAGHTSGAKDTVGDYCYLLEVVPRKDDEESENSVNEAQTEIV